MMKKATTLILAAILLLGTLTGCSAEDTPMTHIAVVGADHANSMELPLTGESTTRLVDQMCRTGGQLTLITTEGQPKVVDTVKTDKPDSSLTTNRQDKIVEANTRKILSWMERKAIATTPELDVLSAVQKGARALAGQEGSRYMILCSTLLSTVDPLDFRNNLLDADPAEIADKLEEMGEIPDLKGVEVIVIGAGDVHNQTLTAKDRQKLLAIWQLILQRAGAESITFSSELPADAVAELPYISLVNTDPAAYLSGPVTLDSQAVSFLPDQAVFLDPAAAKAALEPIAQLLLEHPELRILMVGCTASGSEYTKVLSQQRADACAALLTDGYGVSASQIVTLGLGSENPWHVDDLNPDGSFNENAALNRKTVVMDYNSPEAQQIVASVEEVG